VCTSLRVHVHTLSCLLLSDAYVAVAVDLLRDDLVFDDFYFPCLHSLVILVVMFFANFNTISVFFLSLHWVLGIVYCYGALSKTCFTSVSPKKDMH
jgi:hypothetical protein